MAPDLLYRFVTKEPKPNRLGNFRFRKFVVPPTDLIRLNFVFVLPFKPFFKCIELLMLKLHYTRAILDVSQAFGDDFPPAYYLIIESYP